MSAQVDKFKAEHKEKIKDVIVPKRKFAGNIPLEPENINYNEDNIYKVKVPYVVSNGFIFKDKISDLYCDLYDVVNKFPNSLKRSGYIGDLLIVTSAKIINECCAFIASRSSAKSHLYTIDGCLVELNTLLNTARNIAGKKFFKDSTYRRLLLKVKEVGRILGGLLKTVSSKNNKLDKSIILKSLLPNYTDIIIPYENLSISEFVVGVNPDSIIYSDSQLTKPSFIETTKSIYKEEDIKYKEVIKVLTFYKDKKVPPTQVVSFNK